jgi:hypothetical protein
MMDEAHRQGHICEGDEDVEARRGTIIHTALRRAGLEPEDDDDAADARRREVCAQVARQCDAVKRLLWRR